jgi:hypothetical protein
MATSHYFNNYNSRYSEQRLVEDLIVESIKVMGFDGFYLPNDNDVARDLIFGEDPTKQFKTAFQVEFYLSDALSYGGEKEFFSKFGLEIKNNVNVIVSKRSFSERVPQNTFTRPREGDLIYVPFLRGTGELFEIKFTNSTKDFYTLGRKVAYFYELELEKFKYSQEVISTGVPDIDIVVTDSAYTLTLNVGSGTGTFASSEIVFQSGDGTLANAFTSATVQKWTPLANTLTVTNINGTFLDTNILIGASSNAHYVLSTYDPMNVSVKYEVYDNKYIQDSATPIVDTSETNPFGSI